MGGYITVKLNSTFGSELFLSEAEIIEGAKLVGDKNPIHHDTNHTNSKFDGILASGSHISAVFSALIPTHFSQYGNVVGLNMSFQFKLPIYPNRKYTMEWKVCEKEVNGKLNGTIYYLTGAIVGSKDEVALTGTACILAHE